MVELVDSKKGVLNYSESELEVESSKYKHIISDFDGTLVILEMNWEEIITDLNNYLKSKFNFPSKVNSFWELSSKYSSFYKAHKNELDAILRKEEERVLKNKKWKRINTYLWDLLEGKEFSILSNNFTRTVETIMLDEGLIPSFIVGRDKVELPKPEVEGIILILNTFHLKKEDVLLIGDTKWDRLTAERAGISYLGVADRDV